MINTRLRHGHGLVTIGGQGRSNGQGYSLRRSLEAQGVTTREDMERHIATVNHILQLIPDYDVTTYRINKSPIINILDVED